MTKTEELVEALTDLMRAVLNAEQAPESSSDRRRLQAAEAEMESVLGSVILRTPLDTVPDEELLTELKSRMDRGLNLRPWLDAVERLEG